MPAPTVFLSAATIDLKPWRELLAKAFRAAQFRVLVQDDSLGAPLHKVRGLLAAAIEECDCVIHLAGQGYGSSATSSFPDHPGFRCSWTQFEYYYPHQLPTPIPVIAFVCGPALSVMSRPEEGDKAADVAAKIALQQAHCGRVVSGKFTDTPWDSPEARTVNQPIAESIQDLIIRVSEQIGTLQRHQEACAQAQRELLSLVEQIRHIEKGVGSANEKLDRVLAILETAPPPSGIGPNLHQLPPVKANFTGRETDLAALRDLGAHDGGAAAVITGLGGMGGIGKSELAKVLAHEWRPRFPDAQLWLDGYGTRSDPPPPAPGELISQVIRAFHPEAGQLPEDLVALQTLYRQTLEGTKALVVLDNGADAAQSGPLVPPEGCGLIVTSRRNFMVGGKAPYPVGRLPEPEAVALLREICPALNEADAARVAALCCGLPLALRLAGAHFALDGAAPAAVATYLAALAGGRLATLDADAADAGEVTIRETLRLSVDPLTAAERAAWLRLGVFTGDFDADAARAVAGDAADANGLARLVRRNLLERVEAAGGERYRLHDLAGDYARVRLAAEEGEDARNAAWLAHARHYAAVGETSRRLYLAGDALAGLARFDRERVQIEAAFAWLTAGPEGGTTDRVLIDIIDGVVYTSDLRFHPRQRIAWLDALATAARRIGFREAEGVAFGNLGNAHLQLGEARRAIGYYKQHLAIAREIGDWCGEGSGLGNLGIAYGALGENRRAIGYYEQALAIRRKIGDRRGEGTDLTGLGLAHAALSDARRAIGYYEQALAIQREIGDRRGEGDTLGNLGIANLLLGDASRAIDYHEQALAIRREIGDRNGEGSTLCNLGVAHLQLGDARCAIEYHEQALAIARETGDLRDEGNAIGNLGSAHLQLGETRCAIAYREQALAIRREIGDRHGEGADLGTLGLAYAASGDARRAIGYYEQALTIQRDIGGRRDEGAGLWNAALAHESLGERAEALARAEAALQIFEAIEEPNAVKVRATIAEWREEG